MTTSNPLSRGIEVPEIQRRIRKGTIALFDTAYAIDKLPNGDTRDELVSKHNLILTKLNDLQNLIIDTGDKTCYYGFAPSGMCPDCGCEDCEYLKKVIKLRHIPTVEEFDANRIEKAKQYYKDKAEYSDADFL